MKPNLKAGERLDDLEYGGFKIIQNPSLYCFTSDAVLLANMCKVGSKDTVVDLGTGSGIIATIIATKFNPKKVYGIEIQECLYDMAKRSVELNELTDKIEIINAPMQDAPKLLGKESVTRVVCNPPYQKLGNGVTQEKDELAICRHEIKVTLEEIVNVARDLLKFGGKFYIVHQAKRLSELIYLLEKNNLKVKQINMIQPKASKNVDTVIVEAVKGGNDGLIIPPPIIVNNDDNSITEKVKGFYRKD